MGIPFLKDPSLHFEPSTCSPVFLQEKLVFSASPKQGAGKGAVQCPDYTGIIHQAQQVQSKNPGKKKNRGTGH